MRDSKTTPTAAADTNLHSLTLAKRCTSPAASLSRLEQDLQQLQSKWRGVERQMADRDSYINSLESENAELQRQTKKLQKRIDSRQHELAELKNAVRDYRNTIEGMSGDLEGHDKVVADIETQKADLALQVMDLERQLGEWKGRYAEKKEQLAATRDELSERDNPELLQELTRDKEEISRLESKIRKLEDTLQDREQEEMQLRDEIAQTAERVQQAQDKAAEYEIKATELEAVLLETESEKKSAEDELEAQRDLVHVLEKELSLKQENLEILERSADRLSAIHTGIREIDFEIDDLWAKPEPVEDEAADDMLIKPEEILLQPDVMFDPEREVEPEHVFIVKKGVAGMAKRYPLTDDVMTIGRSPDNDIRVNSKYVSRKHAQLEIKGSKVTVKDLSSMNGFSVNSVDKNLHTLQHGDMIKFGRTVFRYEHRQL